jgi:hydrogenase nickel incorporation protein HypA/HybF
VHEYSIVQALLDRVEQEARARGATAIHRLALRIGEQSGVDPVLVASAFEICREGTVCSGARLDVQDVVARWACSRCGTPIARGAVLACAGCGGAARLAEGDEIVLASIEMEVT